MNWMKKALIFAGTFAFLMMVGCSGANVPAEDEAVPTPVPATPEPQVVSFEVSVTPVPTPPPTPTPTPTPGITPVPFSYYAPTVNMTFEELVGGTSDFGEMGSKNVKWPEAYPPADTYKLIVDVYWQVVMAFTRDENGEYTVPVRYMLCSTGDPGIKDGGETRRGTFNMMVPRVRFGHFLSGEAAQYWTLIRGRTYFHSILYDKQNDLSSYQVETYNALGSKNSHGCIRLTVPDARWIWYNIGYGAVCEIRDGDKNDAVTKAIREQLILPEAPKQRVTLKAGSTPNTDNWSIDTYLDVFPKEQLVRFYNEKQPAPALKADDEEDVQTTPVPDGTVTEPGTGGGSSDPGAGDTVVEPDMGTTPGTGGESVDPGAGDTGSDAGNTGSSDSGSTGGDTGGLNFATGTP